MQGTSKRRKEVNRTSPNRSGISKNCKNCEKQTRCSSFYHSEGAGGSKLPTDVPCHLSQHPAVLLTVDGKNHTSRCMSVITRHFWSQTGEIFFASYYTPMLGYAGIGNQRVNWNAVRPPPCQNHQWLQRWQLQPAVTVTSIYHAFQQLIIYNHGWL